MSISLSDIRKAKETIKPYISKTPLLLSDQLSGLFKTSIFLKCESLQKTGSFKIRGAANRLSQLTKEEASKGVITSSAGNHGRAVAYYCKLKNISCTVVMPSSSPKNKVQAIQELGATVTLHEHRPTMFERTEQIRSERNLTFIHSYDDPYIIAGQGTVGLEIYDDLPDADMIIAGVGGGGLISGTAVALKSLNSKIKIIGVEPEGAATLTEGLKKGAQVTLSKIETIVDGLSPPNAGKLNIEISKKFVDDVILVSDNQIIDAVKLLLDKAKLFVELAGAAGIAAILSGKVKPGKKTVVILSGGNLDLDRLKSWI
ncbi:MAG: threonine/serine dehydratase [Planctomycetes bacterium]|nr:threonine/serine dehydratase [Planctomycetota bacterium]